LSTADALAVDGELVWRCRRGMRELDTLLSGYLQTRYPAADAVERRAFKAMLELADPELWACLLGQGTPPDPEMRHVIEHIARTCARP
jgi:antitoxin CptB